MMHDYGNMGFIGMHAIWWLFWLVIIIGGLVFFKLVPKSRIKDHKDNAFETLQKRYARGEVSLEEYKEKKAHLRDDMGFSSGTNARHDGPPDTQP